LQQMRKQGSMDQWAAVISARSATTKQVWRPKQVVPWVESKFMADKAIIALRSKIWVMHCWSSSLANFDLCECFLAHKLYQKTGGICSHPKLARLIWPVRPVGPTGQTGVSKTIKYILDFTIG
jgi:hypothetical protein